MTAKGYTDAEGGGYKKGGGVWELTVKELVCNSYSLMKLGKFSCQISYSCLGYLNI